MEEKKKTTRPPFLLGGFSRITDVDWATAMAKQGGGAGFLLSASETIGAVMTFYGLDPTTFKPVAKMDFASLEFVVSAAISAALILVLLLMSWRVYVGKGYVSSVLLLGLLIYEAYSKILGGTLNAGWGVVYVGMMVYLIGGARAAWYLGKARKTSNPVSHF